MKLNNGQYNELVEKLADEILEGQLEKEAGIKNVLSGKNVRTAAGRLKDVKAKSPSAEILSRFSEKAQKANKATISGAKKAVGKEVAKTTGAYAGIAGATGAGALAAKAIKDKKDSKSLEEKAAEAYDYAIRKIAACEEMYSDALADQEACIEVLAEVGLYDENGFNKEAAEETDETMEFSAEVSNVYDESLQKIAAAEECYVEAMADLEEATGVLEQFGYEFN